MKIAFFVNGYYPNYSTNGICVKKIVDEIKGEHEIHIVCKKTQKRLTFDEYFEGVFLHRIETKETKIRSSFDELVAGRKSIKSFFAKIFYFLYKFLLWIKPLFQKYTLQNDLISAFYEKMTSLHDFDIFIACCFPFEALVALSKYKQTNKKVLCKALLFDKFSDNKATQKSYINYKLKYKKQISLEQKILSSLDSIVATYDWKKRLDSFHLSNTKFIEIPSLISFNSLSYTNETDFVYSGLINKKIRPIDKVFKILKTVLKETKLTAHFYVKGNQNSTIRRFCSKNDRFVYHGEVPLDVSYSAISKCQFLMSIGNLDVSQTPSKIFEYICTGKPIVHFFYSPKDRCIEILEKYDNAFCFNLTSYDKRDIESLVKFLNNPKKIIEIKNVFYSFQEADPRYAATMILENDYANR